MQCWGRAAGGGGMRTCSARAVGQHYNVCSDCVIKFQGGADGAREPGSQGANDPGTQGARRSQSKGGQGVGAAGGTKGGLKFALLLLHIAPLLRKVLSWLLPCVQLTFSSSCLLVPMPQSNTVLASWSVARVLTCLAAPSPPLSLSCAFPSLSGLWQGSGRAAHTVLPASLWRIP